MRIYFNLKTQSIFMEEVEHFLMQNSTDVLLKSLTIVSIFLVLMTNGSLIYFIIRQRLRDTIAMAKSVPSLIILFLGKSQRRSLTGWSSWTAGCACATLPPSSG